MKTISLLRFPLTRATRILRCLPGRSQTQIPGILAWGIQACCILVSCVPAQSQEKTFHRDDLHPTHRYNSVVSEQTRWSFRAKSDVEIGTPVIRLGDIIEPIDRNLPAWSRLSQSAIGLVPIGGQTMVIDRERLTRIILNHEATPRQIEWIGATKIQVRYREGASSERFRSSAPGTQPQAARTPASDSTALRQVNYDARLSHLAAPSLASPQPSLRRITSTQRRRAMGWAKMGIKRYAPEVAKGYAYEIPKDQEALVLLSDIGGITDCQPLAGLADGDCLFRFTARSYEGIKTVDLLVQLKAHPLVVVPTRAIGRGQRVMPGDLKLAPVPLDDLDDQPISDPQSIVGMEVRTPLRTGRPVRQSDIGAPILIHRGDLIEVRVLGGGVQVTTNAKAISKGAAGELIQVETMEPKRRIVARVADVGVAEIVTRAPVIR